MAASSADEQVIDHRHEIASVRSQLRKTHVYRIQNGAYRVNRPYLQVDVLALGSTGTDALVRLEFALPARPLHLDEDRLRLSPRNSKIAGAASYRLGLPLRDRKPVAVQEVSEANLSESTF